MTSACTWAAALGLRFGEDWLALGEVVSYDQDELFVTFGLRKKF